MMTIEACEEAIEAHMEKITRKISQKQPCRVSFASVVAESFQKDLRRKVKVGKDTFHKVILAYMQ